MMRLTSAIISGIAVGMMIGAGATMSSDEHNRRRVVRGSKRALRKAGHIIDDIF